MARTVVLLVLAGLLVSTAWLRLESGGTPWEDLAKMLGLGFLPALAVVAGWRRLGIAALTAAVSLLAVSVAFGVALTEARPRDGSHDFFGPVLADFRRGFLAFYDTELPFAPGEAPFMHSVVLVAVFGFVAAAGLLIAARRPVAAALALLLAVGWPATLIPGPRPLLLGALALVGVLAVLFLLRDGPRPARGLGQGIAVALALVAVAAAASTSDAVAKGAFLAWQGWDPYNRPDNAVGVRYVWNSHYRGIRFPDKRTVVLRVRTPERKRNLYWRATTLDEYTGTGWAESLTLGPPVSSEQVDTVGRNPLLPRGAADEDNWVRQDFTVEALRDQHLSGSAQPVRWRPPEGAGVRVSRSETAVLPQALQEGQRYTVWSYIPGAKPSQLAKAGADYPDAVAPYLEAVQTVPVPSFDVSSRDALMAVFFDRFADDFLLSSHQELYEEGREVVGDAGTPYAAAVALERWFRSDGGFTYSESPPPPVRGGIPPLVDFVTRTKTGYCQHYAGAMALMLRLLGVPARVAAGFTSGVYDDNKKEWVVTDHEAHTWVEVFFPGFGWLPFDPTPGRGTLDAPYSSVAANFDVSDFRDPSLSNLLGSSAAIESIRRQEGRPGQETAAGFGAGRDGAGGAASVVRDRGPSLLALVALVLAGAFLVVAAAKAIVRRFRFASRDPRALAGACRRDLVGFLADQGIDLPQSATLTELGHMIERDYAIDTGTFVRSAAAARFGPPEDAERAVARARRELRRIRREVRRQLGFLGRLRGAVSLRSLTS